MIEALALASLVIISSLPLEDPDFTSTGNGLLRSCQEKAGSFELALCSGYIIGVIDGLVLGAPIELPMICIPPRVSNGQKRDIVIKYLTEHPEERHKDADLLVAFAIVGTFPCAPKK